MMADITMENLTWDEIYERHMFGDPCGMSKEEYQEMAEKIIDASRNMSEEEFVKKLAEACEGDPDEWWNRWKERRGIE